MVLAALLICLKMYSQYIAVIENTYVCLLIALEANFWMLKTKFFNMRWWVLASIMQWEEEKKEEEEGKKKEREEKG